MKLVTAQEMKEIDQLATEKYGIPGLVLMDAAAKQVADEVMELLRDFRNEDRDSDVPSVDRMPTLGKVVVLCGGGNNGGDGFGAARWLSCYGVQVKVFLIGTSLDKISGDAAAELAMVRNAGIALAEVQSEEDWLHVELAIDRANVVVDAIIGTGFAGELRAPARRACQLMNKLGKHVLAIDMPTGVNADDGSAHEN